MTPGNPSGNLILEVLVSEKDPPVQADGRCRVNASMSPSVWRRLKKAAGPMALAAFLVWAAEKYAEKIEEVKP